MPNQKQRSRKQSGKELRAVRVVDGRIEGPDLLTQSEVAALLNIRRETVWAWERRGLLKGKSIGSLKRYPRQALEALLRA